MLPVLLFGVLIFAIPWWRHRRAIGLPGPSASPPPPQPRCCSTTRTILQARTGPLALADRRAWEPAPGMPAVVIIIDEYAELADKAHTAPGDADFIARHGRAVAVTLIAATLRPAHKAPGQGAVQSQMDTRIWSTPPVSSSSPALSTPPRNAPGPTWSPTKMSPGRWPASGRAVPS